LISPSLLMMTFPSTFNVPASIAYLISEILIWAFVTEIVG
jgi:hypothetical protein